LIYYDNKITKIKFFFILIINSVKWGLGIGDWGLVIGDCGLGPIPNPQSPIPNPQFIFKNLKSKKLFS